MLRLSRQSHEAPPIPGQVRLVEHNRPDDALDHIAMVLLPLGRQLLHVGLLLHANAV
jgi:hypothetical protein